jgi:hypothetical protein
MLENQAKNSAKTSRTEQRNLECLKFNHCLNLSSICLDGQASQPPKSPQNYPMGSMLEHFKHISNISSIICLNSKTNAWNQANARVWLSYSGCVVLFEEIQRS